MHIVDFQDRKRTFKKKRKDQLLDTISGEASREKAYCEAARVHDVYSQIQAIDSVKSRTTWRATCRTLVTSVALVITLMYLNRWTEHMLQQYSCKASLVSTIAAAGAFEKFQEKSHR